MKSPYLALSAIALMTLAMASCKGRYADNTPNGETVEVQIEPMVMVVADSDTVVVPPADQASDEEVTVTLPETEASE